MSKKKSAIIEQLKKAKAKGRVVIRMASVEKLKILYQIAVTAGVLIVAF